MNEDTKNYGTFEIEEQQEEVTENASSIPSKRSRKKERPKKKRKKKHYTLKLLILVLVCTGVYFFLHSAVFTVENIQLEENSRFTLEKVQKMTGLKKGVNMFEIKTGACEKKLEESTFISEAKVSRKLPDTITISLELREPVAAIVKDKKYILLDSEGTVLAKWDVFPYYTILEGITVTEAELGETVKVKEEKKYQQYMELIEKADKADLYFRQMSIKDGTIRLYVRKNLYCTGEKENVIEGMEDGNLKAVLYNLSQKGIKKGVVSIGDNKYYSFSKSTK